MASSRIVVGGAVWGVGSVLWWGIGVLWWSWLDGVGGDTLMSFELVDRQKEEKEDGIRRRTRNAEKVDCRTYRI